MRQRMGEKKVKKLAAKTGLPVVGAFVRGNTDHRVDLLLDGGVVACLYRDGEIEIDSRSRWGRPEDSKKES